ncbi:MAG: Cof-type HAD-IIB family hydrolase [Treponema sp.]|jgi:Cof subfamily protein (haloacid dehalogenase superfamily)|nr:Cof-type HAD-IIB family hydrolase [Treponema sp.]
MSLDTRKAIFLDIDETLLLRGKGPFTQDIEQLEKAREQGHCVFLNTGRSLANIPPSMLTASYIDGIVAGGGAHVSVNGKTAYHKWIPEDLLALICDYYLHCGKWCILEGETNLYGINHETESSRLDFVIEILPVKEPTDFSTLYKGTRVTKLTMQGCVTDEERAALQDYFQLNPFSNYSEGIIRGETKASGMEVALNVMGIARENSIAIGDSINDIDMLRFAGIGIAMGNACDELKQIASTLTLDCGYGGVAHAIKQWVLA